MDWFITACQITLGAGALMSIQRAIKGPGLVDRIVALDLILVLLAGGIALHGARDGSELFAPLLIVVALMAFAGTILVARFVEWRDVG
ncbi:MAG: monovalent cation/H+ antiporter complex subunit F [Acidimicrobiia bacterium]